MTFDLMREELIKLTTILAEDDIRLFVGGGYGLWLKADYLATNDVETLRDLPVVRTTQDIDVFLGAEVITDARRFASLGSALADLGYKSVPGAEHYQFTRDVPGPNDVPYALKIDLLAPAVVDDRVRMDDRRIRPREVPGLHAHVAPEAVTLELFPFELDLGNGHSVLIPHPFTFLVLKLYAFRDQVDDEDRGLGRYHAYDLFRTIAMMTLEEWNQSATFRASFTRSVQLGTAREIAASHFGGAQALGVLRLREHARDVEGLALDEDTVEEFVGDLAEILGIDRTP